MACGMKRSWRRRLLARVVTADVENVLVVAVEKDKGALLKRVSQVRFLPGAQRVTSLKTTLTRRNAHLWRAFGVWLCPAGRCACWSVTSRWPRTCPTWITPPSAGC
jgi:hypothetical protein